MSAIRELNRTLLATPFETLCRLAEAGFGVTVDAGRLCVLPPPGTPLPAADAAVIRRDKERLIALLSPPPPCGIAPTAEEELAWERDCMAKRAARLGPCPARDLADAACDYEGIREALWRMRESGGVPEGSAVAWAAWARDGGRWREVGRAADWRSAWKILLEVRAAEKAVLPAGREPGRGRVDDDAVVLPASGELAGRQPGGGDAARTEALGAGGHGGRAQDRLAARPGPAGPAGPEALGAAGDGGRAQDGVAAQAPAAAAGGADGPGPDDLRAGPEGPA